MEDTKERMDRLENRIKSNFFEIEKRLAKIEGSGDKNLDQRMHELEDLVLLLETDNTKLKEKLEKGTSKDLDEKLKKMEKKEEDITKRESEIEERISDLEKLIVAGKDHVESKKLLAGSMKSDAKLISNELKMLDNLEKRLTELETKSGKSGFEKLEKKVQELEKGLKEKQGSGAPKGMEARLANLEKSYNEELEKMEREVEKTGKLIVKEEMNHYLDKILERVEMLKGEFENIVKDKESGGEALNSKDIELINELEERIDLLDDKFSSLKGPVGKEETAREYEKRLTKLEEMIGTLKTVKSTVPHDMEDIMERLGDLEEVISKGKMAKGDSDLDKKVDEIEKRLSYIKTKEAVEVAIPENLMERIEKLEKRGTAKQTNIGDEKIEKKIEELESKIASLEGQKFAPSSSSPQAGKDVAIMRRRMDDLETLIKSISLTEVENLLRDETVKRANLANAMKVLEDRMSILESLKTKEGEMNFDILITEFQKIKNSVLNLEKSFEDKATKYLVKNLEEFAKSMDKKMPNLMTKKEYESLMAEIEQLRKISPSHLERRVEIVEKKIDSIADAMKVVYNRIPMIVE